MRLPIILTLAFLAVNAGAVVPLAEVGRLLAKAKPGETIVVKDGTYADEELKWRSPGHAVTVKAETPGGVKITGKSFLRLCGDSLTVSGLDFEGVEPPKGKVVEFRIGNELANVCRLTDCRIADCNPAVRDITSNYIVLHGRNNRVDHCSLTGKLSLGVTLLVNLNDARSLNNRHRIDHNYFGPRPVYGSNGAETMRIGTSQQAYEQSGTIVEENYFYRCNGEVEIISVKSSCNTIRGNAFHECEGVVALRHGKGNTVSGNIFDGNGVRNTGGVRIVDSGHIVENNTFMRLKGSRFFSALALMDAVPNSLPNRYVQCTDVVIKDNLFIDCSNIEFGTGKDMERTLAPAECIFAGNTIMTDRGEPFTFIDPAAGVQMEGNHVEPVNAEALSDAEAKSRDIKTVCGASFTRVASLEESPVTTYIELPEGVLMRAEPYVINCHTTVKGNGTTLRWNGAGGGNFFTITDGGALTIEGVIFDGALQQGCGVVKNAIATDSKMLKPYSLEVSGCEFLNMPESGCCGIKGTKGTFAETFNVKNCKFANLSGNGISLADETDDKGRYSADDITVEGCSFYNMLGIPVNIYRGGSDESTAGPYVEISNCTFTDCCNRERGSVLRLIGPQVLTVKDCTFNNSGRGGCAIRLDETTWEKVSVEGCAFNDAGRVISNRDVLK